MKWRIFLVIAVISLTSFKGAHKFYVSVTEIEYNEQVKSLQVISRVFTDDFENVLQTRYDKNLRLSANGESNDIAPYIEKYLEQKLKVKVDGKPVKINYLGKEYENDMLLFYIEIPNVEQFKTIIVNNSILMDLFEDQKNLVHVEHEGKTKSMVLISGKEEGSLKF